MSKTVSDVIDFEMASPEELFGIITNSEKISEITGFRTNVSMNEGDEFSALNGGVKGRNLYIAYNKMIVQSWRRVTWRKDWLDAVVVMVFTKKEQGTRIDLTNANLPEIEVQFIDWNTYWNPIRSYLMKEKHVTA